MSVTSYINYHRRPRVQYMTVAEYNKKNNTNVEVPAGFENEFESALMDARSVTDPNDFIQHSFTNMARRRGGGRRSGGGVSRKPRGAGLSGKRGAGLSGKKPGRTYTQWTPSRIKGSVKKPRGTVPGALRNKGRSGHEDVRDKIEDVLAAMGVNPINLESRAGQKNYPDLRRDKDSLDDIPRWATKVTNKMNQIKNTASTMNDEQIQQNMKIMYEITDDVLFGHFLPQEDIGRMKKLYYAAYDALIGAMNNLPAAKILKKTLSLTDLDPEAIKSSELALITALPLMSVQDIKRHLARIIKDPRDGGLLVSQDFLSSLYKLSPRLSEKDRKEIEPAYQKALLEARGATLALEDVTEELKETIEQALALEDGSVNGSVNGSVDGSGSEISDDEELREFKDATSGTPELLRAADAKKAAAAKKAADEKAAAAKKAAAEEAAAATKAAKEAAAATKAADEEAAAATKAAAVKKAADEEAAAAERLLKAVEKQSLKDNLAKILFNQKGEKYSRLQDVNGKLQKLRKKAEENKLDEDGEIIKAIEQATSRRDSFALTIAKEKEIAATKKKEIAEKKKKEIPAPEKKKKQVDKSDRVLRSSTKNPEEADLDAFLDDYEEDVTYEEVAPGDDMFDEELEAFLASSDDESPPAAAPKKKSVTYANEPSLDSRIDSFLSEVAQDSETFARDRAHVIHFATASGSLKSQLMKGRDRYLERLSAFLEGDKTVKVRMMDNSEVLVSSLRPNRSSLRSMLKEKAGAPRYCKCD